MTNNLIDASIKTMIGQLPSIINHNNEMIKKEFDSIVDSSTQKMKLDVQSNSVKATTGNFTNLIVNNIQLDASTLEHYNILHNQLKDISEKVNGTETPMLYSASYVNEDADNMIQSSREINVNALFEFSNGGKTGISNVQINELYNKVLFREIEGIRIPVYIGLESEGNNVYCILYHDNVVSTWNTIERIYVRLVNRDGSIYAASKPVKRKIKMSL